MKIYMIYSKEYDDYLTGRKNGREFSRCFSTIEKAVDFLKNVREKDISDFYGIIGNTVIFNSHIIPERKIIYEIDEIEVDNSSYFYS